MSRLLWAGVAGPLVYLATVVVGAAVTPGYSHLVHAVSELTQRGAPHAFALGAGFALSAVLCGVFGVGVFAAGARLRMTGALIAGYAIIALMLATIFPMDPIGGETTTAGMMHLALVGVSAVVLVVAMLAAGLALRREQPGFLGFSALAVTLMLLGGAMSALMIANGVALTGIAERLTLASYLVWFVALAFVLMPPPSPSAARS